MKALLISRHASQALQSYPDLGAKLNVQHVKLSMIVNTVETTVISSRLTVVLSVTIASNAMDVMTGDTC
jgi:hypothetical protein